MADPVEQEPASPGDSASLDCADWWAFGVTSALTLLGYLLTLTPEVGLDWSGVLTTGAMYGGVGPPAGYPAWTLYSWLFIKLIPGSNPAWRVAVASAFAAAVSCGLIALMVSRSNKFLFNEKSSFHRLTSRDQIWIRVMSGYVAGMALGFSDDFWFEAVVADFVTFTVLLFTIVLFLLMRWMETGHVKSCRWAFFVFGLLLTNAQEMLTALPGIVCAVMLIDRKLGRDLAFLLLPVAAFVTSITQYGIWKSGFIDWPLLVAFAVPIPIAIILIIATRRLGSNWKPALACTSFFLLGFAVYLYLPIASATNPPVNWSYSRTLEGFVHLIGRGQFEHVNPANSWAEFGAELWRMTAQTGREFGWLYIIFTALPFLSLLCASCTARKWMGVLFLISICIGPLLVALLNMPDGRQAQELAETYFLPLRVPLALCTGMGLIYFATTMARLSVTSTNCETVSHFT
jgi:hypothetical protein